MAKKKYQGSELFDENATPNPNNMEDLTRKPPIRYPDSVTKPMPNIKRWISSVCAGGPQG